MGEDESQASEGTTSAAAAKATTPHMWAFVELLLVSFWAAEDLPAPEARVAW